MRSPNRRRYEAGLREAIVRLRSRRTEHYEEVWQTAVEVLECLNRCEKAEENADSRYFAERDGTDGGKTLGGLVWIRGKIVHEQVEMRQVIDHPIALGDGSGLLLTEDGRPLLATVQEFKWLTRSEAGLLGKPDPHCRDVYYDMYVQQTDLITPLERAASYLLSR